MTRLTSLPGKGEQLAIRIAHHTRPPVILAVGAVRSSKTTYTLIGLAMAHTAGNLPPGLKLFLANSLSAFERNVGPILTAIDPTARPTHGGKKWYWLGEVWEVIGVPNITAEAKLRGATISTVYADELSTYPEAVYRQLRQRTALLIGTTNPETPAHWLHAELNAKDVEVVTFKLFDNPHLTPERIEHIETANRQAGAHYYDRNVLGLWVSAAGRIWTPPQTALTEIPPDPDSETIVGTVIGVDYGDSSPTCAIEITVTPERMVAVGEWWRDPKHAGQRSPDEQASSLTKAWNHLEWSHPWKRIQVYVDPSAAGMITSLKRHGWGVRKAKNEVRSGIHRVANLLSMGRLQIMPSRCPELMREMDSYTWDKPTATGLERPMKEADHACDALRYAVRSARWAWSGWDYM